MPAGTPCVDIEERCDQGCLSIYGLVTDPDLNARFLATHRLWSEGKTDLALRSYQEILSNLRGKDLAIETALYSYIIQIYRSQGDHGQEKEWRSKLKAGKPPHYREMLEALGE